MLRRTTSRTVIYMPTRGRHGRRKAQLIHYDERVFSTWRVFMYCTGTVFSSKTLWASCCVYWGLALTLCVSLAYWEPEAERISHESFQNIVNYFATIIGFLLGLYLSTALSRWWAARQCISELWCWIANLVVVASVHLPEDMKEAKAMLRRYGLASFHLTFDAARGSEDLNELMDRGLLTKEEAAILQRGNAAKAELVWGWVLKLFSLLAEKGRFAHPDMALGVAHKISLSARSAVSNTWTYVDTQLPFSYVHLLGILVHINSIFVGLLSGIVLGKCTARVADNERAPMMGFARDEYTTPFASRADAWNVSQLLIQQLLFLFTIPVFYHGLLRLAERISNPFGYDETDFPKELYCQMLEEETLALQYATEHPPHLIRRLAQGDPFEAAVAGLREPTVAGGLPEGCNADLQDCFRGDYGGLNDSRGSPSDTRLLLGRESITRQETEETPLLGWGVV
ncbi:unnamed protein product [Vitrella brassicaformis CCMP3155]|uniref:Bestrophin homolog n=1 Tax=Vitrella brassicaformis (strain CCMP3155) TaxID=1169540 RepID=A0A0G4FPA7_VITBC|nr:unnamed protein product [Vitrella brassicaformis CCMP3155]|mmetsp:Transcript_44288/g.125295  ORF Transcript_44288/g.125295 Transcript_44288/m.125295 type:complete len:455 (+) Transcript_44288:75-1439(+)|eukprot:CEM15838.1 unnamed protein product [Vitrella brassicaformis CCMP3155]